MFLIIWFIGIWNRLYFIKGDVRILRFKFIIGLYVIRCRLKSVFISLVVFNFVKRVLLFFVCSMLLNVLCVVVGVLYVVIVLVKSGVFVKVFGMDFC